MGLDQPAPVQYAAFLAKLVRFDFGTSARSGQPVLHEVLARLPGTAELAATSIALAAMLGIGAGFVAALHHNRRLDALISALMLFGISMPVYWLGLMLIVGLRDPPAVAAGGWLAGSGRVDPADTHAGRVLGGADRAHDAVDDARGPARELHPHRSRQGAGRPQRRVRTRAAQWPAYRW